MDERRRMFLHYRHLAAALLAASIYPSFSSAEILGVHCPLGCPSSPPGNQVVVYHLFSLSNNTDTKFADWVAYEVDVRNFGVSPGRNFTKDPLLNASVTLEKEDYRGAHDDVSLKADKGHQAPLATFARNEYWYETNYLSNITPQDADLNEGPWMHLEEAVRGAVAYRKPLYVITGPTYEGTRRMMPNADEQHDVPDGYFKIVYNLAGNAASFWMPQTAERSADYCGFKKSLNELQQDIHFQLPALHNSTDVLHDLGC